MDGVNGELHLDHAKWRKRKIVYRQQRQRIFLPAAGELGEPENDNFLAGDEGCYWSSSLGNSGPSAWQLDFWVTSGEDPEERFVATYVVGVSGGAGLSIRPVSD